ncbi:MAG: peptidylprolyl isomerase [Kiritimatiellae bacterium]|nr:peptidylprolyl isomerase [Kiritimatiellia bacterium]
MVGLAVAGWGWGVPVQAQTNGLFADFSTSAGAFTVELDFIRAPRTVAHFVRLSEGAQSWMDPVNGVAQTGTWYVGSGLYRVQYEVPTPGTTNLLALQGGLREVEGDWAGGPGYGILDEVTNGLSHSNGVISMVTDGPHTGAAEFMILLTNGANYWDGRQTVFGRVSAGMAVVQALAEGAQIYGQLASPVVMTNVTIRRVGATAEMFSTDRADLPLAQTNECRVDILSSETSQYVCVKGAESETLMVHTAHLLNPQWDIYSFGFNGSTQAVDLAVPFRTTDDGWTRHFFHGSRVVYPVFSAIPLESMSGIIFAAQWGNGEVHQYWLNLVAQTGYWQNVSTTGAVVKINDCQQRTRGANCTQLNFMDQNGNVFDYVLGFDSPGDMTGRYFLSLKSQMTGESLGEEWGDCQYAAWSPGVTAKRAAATSERWVGKGTEAGPVQPKGIHFLNP